MKFVDDDDDDDDDDAVIPMTAMNSNRKVHIQIEFFNVVCHTFHSDLFILL